MRERGKLRHPHAIYGGKFRYRNGIASDPEGCENADFDSGRSSDRGVKGFNACGAGRGLEGGLSRKSPVAAREGVLRAFRGIGYKR